MNHPRLTLLCLLSFTGACSMVGETGRSRIAWFPESYMNQLGASSYDEATSGSHPLITSGPDYEMLQRLGRRIAEASHRNYDWEFRLLDAPEVVNAFCLPGGKVAVYTGILPITQNEDGLAAVVGHEVAHATAEHGNERMTQNMMAAGILSAGDLVLDGWGGMDPEERAVWVGALGIGAQFGILMPFSRTHESEADEIGLRYLVRAGYDPEEAPRLWERMAAASPERPPEFMSTHPDPLNRAQRLRELIPQVVAEEGAGSR